MRFVPGGVTAALAVSLLSTSAFAYPKGIIGFSGKSDATCTTCHQPGAAVPTVEISGPSKLAVGETGQYTFIIRGGPAKVGGAGIAVSDATASLTAVTGAGLMRSNGELIQTPAKPFTNEELRFDFAVVAPTSAGSFTLFAAGNSANGDGLNTGDGIAHTKLDVTVSAATDSEEEGGCSSAGGAPMWLLSLLAGGALLRRSRTASR
ncbi:MXAN_6652 family MXYO-CTERM-anchored protein [Melittangium boletus]|uniref:Cytochrome c domain-containing protein n=1 Tax=Melittangium boletus DSM 14713 TaxID=1294270 RepID=A0A250IBR5_9BACT|nr:MXAN_6652 family MXYO-CTERM-anchored protein [Melittangium boletus]ATB28612.1 hypothetical protein MEBOL_002061 [Melittangium boletus DSM 14713]